MPGTPKHVFISHSARDDAIGRRVCAILEGEGIPCWYSSRPKDLEPGLEWDDSIAAALRKSAAVVLLFSAASDQSKWVKRELLIAAKNDIPVLPVRLEDVEPTGGMEVQLVSVQWIEAFKSFDTSLALLVTRLRPLFPLAPAPPRGNASPPLRLPPARDSPKGRDAPPDLSYDVHRMGGRWREAARLSLTGLPALFLCLLIFISLVVALAYLKRWSWP
jgi:hypothetical protein